MAETMAAWSAASSAAPKDHSMAVPREYWKAALLVGMLAVASEHSKADLTAQTMAVPKVALWAMRTAAQKVAQLGLQMAAWMGLM